MVGCLQFELSLHFKVASLHNIYDYGQETLFYT